MTLPAHRVRSRAAGALADHEAAADTGSPAGACTAGHPGRRSVLRLALGLGALPVLGSASTGPAPRRLIWRERALIGFGTTLSLQAGHADARAADAALDAAVAAIRRVEAPMNLFDPGSALCRLNRDGRLDDPPEELRVVLSRALAIARDSDGAFDPTVQPLWTLFDAARRDAGDAQARAADLHTAHPGTSAEEPPDALTTRRRQAGLPSPAEVEAARRRVGWRDVELAPSRIVLHRPGMALTLNGIAQGHAVDRVRDALRGAGIADALFDAGEWGSLGRRADGGRWTLGIADPRDEAAWIARLALDGRCVATSADNASAFSADRRHHHIVDPHTGWSPPDTASVTVAAASGALADALTKVLFVAGPARALQVARRWGVDALVVDKAGRWQATPGLSIG